MSMPLHKKRQKARLRKYMKRLKRIVERTYEVETEIAELREKNLNVITELQNERMKCSTLFSEITFLKLDNLNLQAQINSTSSAQFSTINNVSAIEIGLRELASKLIQASSVMTTVQSACDSLRATVSLDAMPNNSSSSPVSSNRCFFQRQSRALKLAQRQPPVKYFGDTLDMIEENSHENSVSPQVPIAGSSKYERRCKEGLCHMLNQRTTRANCQKNENQNPMNPIPVVIDKDDVTPSDNPEAPHNSEDEHAASSSSHSSNYAASDEADEDSPIRDIAKSNVSKEIEENSNVPFTIKKSLSNSSKTFDSDLELTNLESPKESATVLSFEPVSTVTYRRQYKINSPCSISFHSDTEDKTIVNDQPSKNEPALDSGKENRTIVPLTEKKKAIKSKKPSSKTKDKNRRKSVSVNELFSSFDTPVSKSTPVDEEKQPTRKRRPLVTLASSTVLSSNGSNNWRDSGNQLCKSQLSLSPILETNTVPRVLHDNTTTTECLESYDGTCNNSSGSTRPRRNAAKNANYKEPRLGTKLRR